MSVVYHHCYIVTVAVELTLSLNTSHPVIAGDSVSIICSAKINKTLVNIEVDVDMYIVSPRGIDATERSENVSLGLYQKSVTFSSISPRDSGVFMCNATVKSSSVNNLLYPAYEEVPFDLVLGEYHSEKKYHCL